MRYNKIKYVSYCLSGKNSLQNNYYLFWKMVGRSNFTRSEEYLAPWKLDRWSKLFLHEFFRPTYLTWLLSGQEIKFFDLAKNDLKNFQSPVSILWNSIFRSWDFDLGSVPSEPIHYRRELRRRHYGSKLPIDNQCGQRRCC